MQVLDDGRLTVSKSEFSKILFSTKYFLSFRMEQAICGFYQYNYCPHVKYWCTKYFRRSRKFFVDNEIHGWKIISNNQRSSDERRKISLSSIVHLQLRSLEERLKEQETTISLTDKAIQSTLRKSYNPSKFKRIIRQAKAILLFSSLWRSSIETISEKTHHH